MSIFEDTSSSRLFLEDVPIPRNNKISPSIPLGIHLHVLSQLFSTTTLSSLTIQTTPSFFSIFSIKNNILSTENKPNYVSQRTTTEHRTDLIQPKVNTFEDLPQAKHLCVNVPILSYSIALRIHLQTRPTSFRHSLSTLKNKRDRVTR